MELRVNRDVVEAFLLLAYAFLYGCSSDVADAETPHFQVEVELPSREEVYNAGRQLQSVIEAHCELIGEEKPMHQRVNGQHALMLIFAAHDLDGKRVPGAVLYSSFGDSKLSLKLAVFASAFNDEAQLETCISAVDSRIASGFADPLTDSDAGSERMSSEEAPTEAIGSIYDLGLEYSTAAVVAAQDHMDLYERDSYLRYEPVAISTESILQANYTDDRAVPDSLRISPFSDVSVIADRIDYQVMEHIQSALWVGSIRGHRRGTVEIAIVRGDSIPAFVVSFVNYPSAIRIVPTESGETYVAIEDNPHYRDSATRQ